MDKIEAGRIELFPEEVDVGTLAAGLAATVRGLLVGKPVSFELDVAPDLPPMQADATRLRQILLNLLSNAARYTEKGSIECRLSRPDPDHLLIEVQDTGVGIPADEQATLWQPFVQTASGLRAGQGTGLGLPITRHLVELHGGEIWFESVEGAGSTFLVRLPLRR
jgi:signal transduction histidine kinase